MLFVASGRSSPASEPWRITKTNQVQTIRKKLAASFYQLRTRLVLVVVLAVIPALFLTLYIGVKQKHQAAEQANRELLNVTKMVASEQERVLNGAKQFLGVLVHVPEVRSLEPGLCDPLLASLLKNNPLYANFGVVDRNGTLICSALPFVHPINYADRMWFRRAADARAFAVGDYVVSRTAHAPTLTCSCPFFDDEGNVLGIAFAALDLRWEGQLLSSAHLPEGTVATLLDSSGNILARSDDSEKWLGRSVADVPFIQKVLARRNEGTSESAGIDGVIRIFAFTPLKETGGSIVGYLILGVPPDVAYAASNRMMVHSLVILSAVGAFAVAAAWVFAGTFVLRRTRDLVAAANRLRAGDLTSRTRPDHQFGEFADLAIAFNEMADAIEQHRDHLEQMVATRTAELKEINDELSADITERKRLEEALLLSEKHTKELLASVTDYIYTVHFKNGTVGSTSHGPGCLSVTGYSSEDYANDAYLWYRVVHPDDRPAVVSIAAKMASGEVMPPLEHRIFHRDGSVRWVRNQRVLRHTPDGQIAGYDGLISDITERKVAEDALRKALSNLQESHEELKASQLLLINTEKLEITGRLAAGVAHEVKNPLAILAMSLDYLSRVLTDRDETVADVLNDMRDAIGRADRIIRGLLDFSASEKLDLQPEDLNSVIEQATLLVRHTIKSNRVELVKSLAPDLPPVALDQNKTVQALVNLFSNSLDAMPDGGTLTVRSYYKQSSDIDRDENSQTSGQFTGEAASVVVEIEDSGCGIPPDKLPKILDPFFTTKPPGKGTGLGLTVTRKIIGLHGGSLQVTNKEEGGARALLLFPALKAK